VSFTCDDWLNIYQINSKENVKIKCLRSNKCEHKQRELIGETKIVPPPKPIIGWVSVAQNYVDSASKCYTFQGNQPTNGLIIVVSAD